MTRPRKSFRHSRSAACSPPWMQSGTPHPVIGVARKLKVRAERRRATRFPRNELTPPFSHFQLAGNAYHGVGVPDCIHGGEQAAERLLTSFSGAGS